jgi:hypothetical protein
VGRHWIRSKGRFLFPVRALSRVFRAKYLELLQHKLAAGHEALLADLRRMEWVVYAKRPFAGPEQVLDYFGRYTHRIAISNHRLVCHQDGLVTFR